MFIFKAYKQNSPLAMFPAQIMEFASTFRLP